MATLKRPWSNLNETDDEDEPLAGRRMLPVARLPEDFDGEPMDGMQYLFTVRRDARKLPHVTSVANPYVVTKQEPDGVASTLTKRRHVELPSEEWRSIFQKRFKNFRKNLVQPAIGVSLPIPAAGRSKPMPEKKERDNWWAFINGRPEYDWNPPKRSKKPKPERNQHSKGMRSWDDISLSQYEVRYAEEPLPQAPVVVNEYGEVDTGGPTASLPTPSTTPQPEEKPDEPGPSTGTIKRPQNVGYDRADRPRQPTPSLLKAMDSRYCVHLLMYFTHWITQHLEQLESSQPLPYPLSSASAASRYSRLTQTHARWIFALLARVDEHLTSDEMSNLRSLARACLNLVKDLNKNQTSDDRPLVEQAFATSSLRTWDGDLADAPMDERSCWIVVTAVTEFWGQRDLWMDADNLLNV